MSSHSWKRLSRVKGSPCGDSIPPLADCFIASPAWRRTYGLCTLRPAATANAGCAKWNKEPSTSIFPRWRPTGSPASAAPSGVSRAAGEESIASCCCSVSIAPCKSAK
eukprot:1193706-Prorocentrum_minimum.AAC.1